MPVSARFGQRHDEGGWDVFLIGDDLCWSASDLTAAAECEYAVLRQLDYVLKRNPDWTSPKTRSWPTSRDWATSKFACLLAGLRPRSS